MIHYHSILFNLVGMFLQLKFVDAFIFSEALRYLLFVVARSIDFSQFCNLVNIAAVLIEALSPTLHSYQSSSHGVSIILLYCQIGLNSYKYFEALVIGFKHAAQSDSITSTQIHFSMKCFGKWFRHHE